MLDRKEALLKLRESINEALDKKIAHEAMLEEAENIKSLNFAALTEAISKISDRLFFTNEGKKVIGKVAKVIKESKDAQSVFMAVRQMLSPKGVKDASVFVNEGAACLNSADRASVEAVRKELGNIIVEHIKASDMSEKEVADLIAESNVELTEDIDKLIGSTKSSITERSNAISALMEHVKSANVELAESSDFDAQEALDKLSEGISGDDAESEIILSALKGKTPQDLFEEKKQECVGMIDEALKGAKYVDDKARLQGIKQSLEKKLFNESTLDEDISKLMELKEVIKNS